MILQYLLLVVLVFLCPLFPPVIMPFVYSLLWVLLVQWADPRILSLVSIVVGTVSCVITRWAWKPITAKINEYKHKRNHEDWLSKIERTIASYLDKQNAVNSYWKKIEAYAEKPHGKVMFALIIIFLLQSSVPDVIAIKFLHKRVSFWFFSWTAFLGKAVVYLPFIFLGMGLIQFTRTHLWR